MAARTSQGERCRYDLGRMRKAAFNSGNVAVLLVEALPLVACRFNVGGQPSNQRKFCDS